MGNTIGSISITDTNKDGIVDANDQVTIKKTTIEEKEGKTFITTKSTTMDAEEFCKRDEYGDSMSPTEKLTLLRDKMKKNPKDEAPKASSDLLKLCQDLTAKKKNAEKNKVAAK